MMKKNLLLLLFCIACSMKVFPAGHSSKWGGDWMSSERRDRSIVQELPFHSESINDAIVINNENPDRDIHYEVMDKNGNVLLSGDVSKENSAWIVIPISTLTEGETYTIVLTSTNPQDRAYSTFIK